MYRTLNSLKPLAVAITIAAGATLVGSQVRAAPLETTVVAGGCFWCVEADFEHVKGVTDVVSGYAGGKAANPTYKEVSRGGTGHLEVVEITYDPDVISYPQILHLFLRSIDPLDGGGQFCDRGAVYAPALFPATAGEKRAATAALQTAASDLGVDKVEVAVLPAAPFYPAEDYHQDYYKKDDLVLTRFGPVSKAAAYKKYRDGCGRDQRIKALWGDAAPFAGL
ncbi:peptide-methionine (S)-S-oxide reductase MsrA [Pseudoruegeria sp. SK021]|uniref:peptide-methionine (S)-S-oxide reductase MsrA n=1 Tax=Pseudoruegeria sp. SK021 TaxID=1933035 RepID=UPI000A240680|nr:peptide-methionine (S)-S-oxide reductase MsrA [Pseudoruegeria sp. SK021]OSP55326.1 peptide-methionine (S)-S-oxide reductase [Pseudoruegeria sp. SK021]